MKRALITATVQSHICQFHRPLAEVLHDAGYEVHVAAHNNLAEKNGLKLDFAEKVFDIPFSRSPKSTDNIKAYKQLRQIISENDYDLIHCNTPMGGIVTRLAAKKARKKGAKVVYVAHGFHFYKSAPKKNWLVYYPIEKCMARLCDMLITINEEDYQLAKRKFQTRVEHIHGIGVNPDRYHPTSTEQAALLREKEGLKPSDFVVLCTGELNKNKDQKTLIAAASMLRDQIPNLKVLLAGNGPLEAELRSQISALKLEETVHLLGYRTDLECVVPAANLIVSCSLREGLGLNVIEAMLCEKPVVASKNRGHRELVTQNVTGLLVEAHDAQGFANSILELYNDRELMSSMSTNAYTLAQSYTTTAVKNELRDLLSLDNQ